MCSCRMPSNSEGARRVSCRARARLYPLDNAIDLSARDASLRIFAGNEAMMIEADAIIANLTPFRGPGADAGTVYELGFMAGGGKLCLGYCNDPTLYADRVRKFTTVDKQAGRLAACAGPNVEDFRMNKHLTLS